MRLRDGKGAGVDGQERLAAVDDVDRVAAMRRVEPKAPHGLEVEPVEVDAARGAVRGVEGMDEGRSTATVVERVRTASVRARDAAERIATHLLARVRRIDDPCRVEPEG